MNFGTFIYIFAFMFLIIRNRHDVKKLFFAAYLFNLFTKFFLNIGYFVKINNEEFLYSEVTLLFSTLVAIVVLINYRINKKMIIFMALLFISLTASLFLNIFLNYTDIGITYSQSWDKYFYYVHNNSLDFEKMVLLKPNFKSIAMLMRIFIFLLNSYVFVKLIDKTGYKKIVYQLYCITKIVIILCLLEFVLKNIFNSNLLNSIYNYIFGIGESTKLGMTKSGISSITFLYREQSTLAYNFGFLSIVFLIFSKNGKKFLLISILLIFFSLISMSFTSMLFIVLYFFTAIIIFLKSANVKQNIYYYIGIFLLVIILLIGGIIGVKLFEERISNSISLLFGSLPRIESLSITSENIRLYSIRYNMNIFKNHMLFGIGIGISYSHGSISSVLVSIGLVGVLIYILNYIELFKNKNLKYSLCYNFVICVILFFVGGIDVLYSEIILLVNLSYSLSILER